MYTEVERWIGKRFHLIVRHTTCLSCQKPIVIEKTGRPRKTCSDLCRQRRRRKLRHIKYGEANRRARAAETFLKSVERFKGRVDETPYQPRGLLNKRWSILFDLRDGTPFRLCQWCAKPMTYASRHGVRVHCCSKYCRDKFAVFRKRLQDGLIRYEKDLDPLVTLRLGMDGFNYACKEPGVLLRSELGACEHCHRPFAPYSLSRKYCSTRCRQAAYYRRHHKLVGSWRKCPGCNKKFRARHVRQTMCGPDCRIRWENYTVGDGQGSPASLLRRGTPALPHGPGSASGLIIKRACLECGQPILTRNKNQRFCDINCQWRNREHRRRPPVTMVRERCLWCGEKVPPPAPHGGWRRQTCSTRCRVALRRMRQKQPIALPVEFNVVTSNR